MSACFADTSYWIALLSEADGLHQAAVKLSREAAGIIVTSQWVLTELLDGCGSRSRRLQAVSLLRALQSQEDMTIVSMTADLFERGVELYERRMDKEWSLTDCISFLIMHDYDLTDALTADHHFEQAGFNALLKQDSP